MRLPEAWARERKRDYFYRKAKKDKYRSRAAYKLLQAVSKYRFLNKGDVVIDLGAAPGGWMQASRKIVGEEGFVLGVDLKPIDPLKETNVYTFVGNLDAIEIQKQIEQILPAQADVVISDVSPNVSGVWEVDHARQIDLARKSMILALNFLRKGGNFFVKAFQGDMLKDFVEELTQLFARVEIIKPKASRARSAEVFVLGMGLKRRH